MAWRPAKSLVVLVGQLKPLAPTAPAVAWGYIGDANHTSTSDHSPKDFPGWGSDIVTATDFPNGYGLDARTVLDAIRQSRDPRVKYGISNGQMFSSYVSSTGVPAWTWRTYTGADGHFGHGHLSVVGDKRADGEQPWQIGGTVAGEADKAFVAKYTGSEPWISGESWMAKAIELPLRKLQADVAELKGRTSAGAPTDAQLADIADRLRGLLVPALKDAAKAAVREVLGELDDTTSTG